MKKNKLHPITELKHIRGTKILARVDFNVTIAKGRIIDDFRIKKALPTIAYLRKAGAKVILMSHLGENGESLAPVSRNLKKYVPHVFVRAIVGDKARSAITQMKNGDVVLLENLRQDPGETKNDLKFAKALASLADIYVNDAFPVCHRAHASIVGVPKLLPSYAGFQLLKEIDALDGVMTKPKRPFFFILGGAKFETKIPLIKKYLREADIVFIGGALANNFFKEEGLEVGKSLVDAKTFGLNKLQQNGNLFLPIDVIVRKGKSHRITTPEAVERDEVIVDIGPMSADLVNLLIARSKTVLWNGPMGNYEIGFGQATEAILKALAKSRAVSIVGGGDTVALVDKLKLENTLSFVSTGGGATLDFLSFGTLSGIEALKHSRF
jgi:phosphoglycerate kinase